MFNKHAVKLHAKSFLASPRNYLASWQTFFAHGSQTERWSNIQNFDEAWDRRTAMMAEMIAKNSSVLEFGSGREKMKDFLPEGCSYQPSDLAPRSPQTLIYNLNEGFPKLQQQYDYIVFSGVLEYINDIKELLTKVRPLCKECITSYATTDKLECVATRITNGWVNHLSEPMLLELFSKAGFTVVEKQSWREQTIYRLR